MGHDSLSNSIGTICHELRKDSCMLSGGEIERMSILDAGDGWKEISDVLVWRLSCW